MQTYLEKGLRMVREPKCLAEEVFMYPHHHLTRWLDPQGCIISSIVGCMRELGGAAHGCVYEGALNPDGTLLLALFGKFSEGWKKRQTHPEVRLPNILQGRWTRISSCVSKYDFGLEFLAKNCHGIDAKFLTNVVDAYWKAISIWAYCSHIFSRFPWETSTTLFLMHKKCKSEVAKVVVTFSFNSSKTILAILSIFY